MQDTTQEVVDLLLSVQENGAGPSAGTLRREIPRDMLVQLGVQNDQWNATDNGIILHIFDLKINNQNFFIGSYKIAKALRIKMLQCRKFGIAKIQGQAPVLVDQLIDDDDEDEVEEEEEFVCRCVLAWRALVEDNAA